MSESQVVLDRAAAEQALAFHLQQVAVLQRALGSSPKREAGFGSNLVPAKVIAKEIGRSAETVRSWAKKYSLGPEIGGTRYVDRDKWAAYINRE